MGTIPIICRRNHFPIPLQSKRFITDTRFEEISGSSTCYYSIDVKYEGAIPTISFFEYGTDGEVVNSEDQRNIKVIDASSFKMWDYGLTEAENAIIYTKQ